MSTVTSAINHIGAAKVAKKFGIRISAVIRMRDAGRLPKTELAGLTDYSSVLEQMSEGKYTKEALIASTREWWERRVATQQRIKHNEMRVAS